MHKLKSENTQVKAVSIQKTAEIAKSASAENKSLEDRYTIVLSKEIVDGDGEIIMIDGIDLSVYEKNPILLDSHVSGDTVDRILGRVENLRKAFDADGVKILLGEVVFAETDRGQTAKKLVDGGFLKGVSIGFGNAEWEGDKCVRCTLYETSLVTIPANPEALLRKWQDAEAYKQKLQHAKELLRAYRKAFMRKSLWKSLCIEKSGDELKDITLLNSQIALLMLHGVVEKHVGQDSGNSAVLAEEPAGSSSTAEPVVLKELEAEVTEDAHDADNLRYEVYKQLLDALRGHN